MKDQLNIRATMKALQISEYYDFDLARYDYVVSCRARLQNSMGGRFTSEIRKDINKVRITRVA